MALYRWTTKLAGSMNGFYPENVGTTWQVLTRTTTWYEWENATGLVTSVNGNTWAVTVNEVPWTWTTWHILTKTANGYDWAAAPASWIQKASWSPIDLQYIWAWTEAQYTALTNKNENTVYLTI